MPEHWKPITGFHGYSVSDQGRIRSSKGSERILRPGVGPHGHQQVTLFIDGRRHRLLVHRLVMQEFGDRSGSGNVVRHKDGNPSNNRPDNLAWGTQADNIEDRERHGRTARGERSGNAKLSDSDVLEIRRRAASGESGVSLARSFGVSESLISMIKKRQIWRHLEGISS